MSSVLKSSALPDEIERDFLSPAELVHLTGLSLSTIRRYLRSGRLPKLQPGGRRCRVLIPREVVEQLLAAQQTQSSETSVLDRQEATHSPPNTHARHGPQPRWKKQR